MNITVNLLLILLLFGISITFITLFFFSKKSELIKYYLFFQLSLLGVVIASLSNTNVETFFSDLFVNLFSLLFYVFILSISSTLYNFIGLLVFKDFKLHTKIYTLSFLILGVNIISFLYLTIGQGKKESYVYDIVQNVMNYTDFISYLFIFPIITFFYLYKLSKIVFSLKKRELVIQSNTLNLNSILTLFISFLLFILIFFSSLLFSGNVWITYTLIAIVSFLICYSYVVLYLLIKMNKKDHEKDALKDDFSYFKSIEENLEDYILHKKSYTNPKLTLKECAKGINSNEKYLSNYLNKVMNMNFNTYINNLRIDEAKSLLISSDSDLYTIEAIAKMAGFNSKSSFNAVFKKHVGMTPSEFKNKNR